MVSVLLVKLSDGVRVILGSCAYNVVTDLELSHTHSLHL